MRSILRFKPRYVYSRKLSTVAPISLTSYVDEVMPLLKPPVANRMIYNEQLQVMVVGGPNQRKDYHINEGEEIFLQLDGAMDLKIVEKGEHRNIHIPQGHMFILPSRIPHSPQRYADTLGVVVERLRKPHEADGLRYFVRDTTEVLYEEYFHCKDLGSELVPVIERFFATEASKSHVPHPGMPVKNPPVKMDVTTAIGDGPFDWTDFLKKLAGNTQLDGTLFQSVLCSREYNFNIAMGAYKGVIQPARVGKSTVRGSSHVWSGKDRKDTATALKEGDIHLIQDAQDIMTVMNGTDCCLIAITNSAFDN